MITIRNSLNPLPDRLLIDDDQETDYSSVSQFYFWESLVRVYTMPKLHLAKAGHHFTVRNFGASIVTIQINAEGVQFLSRNGISVDDEIPAPLITQLYDRGFAYTGGGGVGVGVKQPKFEKNPDFHFERVNFLYSENEDGPKLQVFLPEISSDVLSQIGKATKKFECAVSVEKTKVPINELWPGKGGTTVDVRPQLAPYRIELSKGWPKDFEKHYPKQIALYRGANVFLFTGQNARKIDKSTTLTLGASYAVVTKTKIENCGLDDFLDVAPEAWSRAGWFCYRFSIPEETFSGLSAWCIRLGYVLQERSWKFSFLSPPPIAFSAEGLPITAFAPVIVSAARTKLGNKSLDLRLEVAGEPGVAVEELTVKLGTSELMGYVQITPKHAGTYILRGTNTWITPLAFRFEPQYKSQSDGPRPLTIKIGERVLESITAKGVDSIIVSQPVPDIETTCSVPVSIVSRLGCYENLTSEATSEIIRKLYASVLPQSPKAECRVSSGNFGSLGLRFNLNPVQSTGIGNQPFFNRQRILAIDPSLGCQPAKSDSGRRILLHRGRRLPGYKVLQLRSSMNNGDIPPHKA